MNRILARLAGTALLAMALGFTAAAQQQGTPPAQPGKTPGKAEEAAPAAPVISPEEEKEYKAFLAVTEVRPVDAKKIIAMGNDFVTKYPASVYAAFMYSTMANAYQTTGDAEKMFQSGEKAIELNPDNIDALSLMAWAIPRRINGQEPDLDQRLIKAENYSSRGITILNALAKPETMAEEDFAKSKNAKLAMCYSGRGLVYLHTQRFADSATDLEKATTLTADPDPVDFYLLGMAYTNAKRPHEAVTAYEKCIAGKGLPPQILAACKQGHADAKKEAANTLKPPTP